MALGQKRLIWTDDKKKNLSNDIFFTFCLRKALVLGLKKCYRFPSFRENILQDTVKEAITNHGCK